MTRRPRLLFLCQTLPYPPDGGVWIRSYNVLRLLAQAFEITALCFERAGGASATHDVSASRRKLSELGQIEVFALPQQTSLLRYGWDHVRSLLSGRVYTAYVYESRAFQTRLDAMLRTEMFDLVHIDSLDLARYVPACQRLPVVVVHHDLEPELLCRRAAVEPRLWARAYLRHQARLMSGVERRWCPQVDLNVVVSERDAAMLRRNAPGSRILVVPNGVDTGVFALEPASGVGIAYVGGTSPFPNLDALVFFSEQILPHIRTSLPDVRVRWIGRATSSEQAYYAQRHNVELTGYVEDERLPMRETACHIVPLRAGGGTRLKILNSWAMGRPVVSTSNGCEGLAAAEGKNILIRDEPTEFARAVVTVLRDPALSTRLGESGRAAVERLYSWDVIGQQMIETYLSMTRQTQSRDIVSAPIRRSASTAPA